MERNYRTTCPACGHLHFGPTDARISKCEACQGIRIARVAPVLLGQNGLTLHAIRGGHFSCTIAEGEEPALLGRAAMGADYLAQDRQVGNRHCLIFREEGRWMVRDNESKNCTMVNGEDIGCGGETALKNGDILTLGHRPDSPAFEIQMEENL